MTRLATLFVALVLFGLATPPARASGADASPFSFVDRHGGSPEERVRLYRGKMGVFLPTASNGLLYLQWRLMNGLDVGIATGAALNAPCCDVSEPNSPWEGMVAWNQAVRLIPGSGASNTWIATELPGPNYTEIPNCFPDAFSTAAVTLRDRVARFGSGNPAVRAWLATQNGVFAACSDPKAVLPAPLANAPAWLKADRAYQEAAFALYKGQTQDAAGRFQAIARDASSPWAPRGLYLSARTLYRAALRDRSPQAYAAAQAAIAPLRARADAYGHGEVHGMARALAYRYRPALLFRKLDEELNAKVPVADLAKGLRDYVNLSARVTDRPDLADWLTTLQADERDAALAHATERWTATHKPHWLVLALTLARADDRQAATLVAAAATVSRNSPAWTTAQYHQMRLTFASGDPAALRGRVDALLASDLSSSDRNLFLGMRTQLATSLPDMMRFAVRRVFCSESPRDCPRSTDSFYDDTLARSSPGGYPIALGPEIKAILDRLPLHDRMMANATLPHAFRLDLTLTNFGRAVQLQDNPAIDQLAAELAILLPAIRQDWLTIRRTPPGPAKRFAEFFVLAKIPGMAPDFAGYSRPEGAVREWQGRWWDWTILPRPAAIPIDPPDLAEYNLWDYAGVGAPHPDLVCGSFCGTAGFPLHLPRFAAAGQPRARAERRRLIFYTDQNKGQLPAGSISVWADLLRYARAHPNDPRSPEALYWLIRITHWGNAHDRVGYKAFRLLHTVHPRSVWTKRSPFYYD